MKRILTALVAVFLFVGYAQAAVLYTPHFIQFFDDNGDPCAGCKLYTYEAGTSTPKATYTTAAGSVPLANPVVMDASGRATIFLSGAYKFTLKTSADVTIRETDNVTAFSVQSSTVDDITGNFTEDTVAAGDSIIFSDVSDNDDTKRDTVQGIIDLTNTTIIAANKNTVLNGLIVSNNGTDATNDLDISAGTAVSDDGDQLITVAAITKRLDAGWTVGSAQGCLDTGSIADTSYHLWAIKRVDTGVTDVLCSASATSPTLPSNYTDKKLIGSFRRASSAIVAFKQYDIGGGQTWTKLMVPVLDINDATPGTSAKTGTLASIPTGRQLVADFATNIVTNTGASYALITSLDQTDTAASSSVFNASGDNANPSNNHQIMTNTSAQIRYRQNSGNTVTMRFVTHGWIDPRR